MPLASLTRARKEALENELARAQAELDDLHATPPEAMWHRDLDAFEVAYHALYGANDLNV
jgi:hypothetical protein